METTWQVTFKDGRPLAAVQMGADGKVLRKTEQFWTVGEFCRQAGKSRRQLYRDMRAKRILPLGKFLGEWLLEPSQLARLKPPPASLFTLFPEYEPGSLDLWKSRRVILPRILRFGGQDRLRWMLSFYGKENTMEFVRQHGAKALDPRSFKFWSLYFGLARRSAPAAVLKGRDWGGYV